MKGLLSKIVGFSLGLFAVYVIGKWFFSNPEKAAHAVNSGAQSARQGGDSIATFLGALSGAGLVVLAIVGVAIYLARRNR